MTEIKSLADACIYYRAKHHLAQEELAEKCGVSRATINKVESGKYVSKLTTLKIRIVVDN